MSEAAEHQARRIPMDYFDEEVKIADIGALSPLDRYRFHRCRILGPAVIFFESGGNHTLKNNFFEGPIEAHLWPVDPQRSAIAGAVIALNVEFVACDFLNVGIAGLPDFLAAFRESVSPVEDEGDSDAESAIGDGDD